MGQQIMPTPQVGETMEQKRVRNEEEKLRLWREENIRTKRAYAKPDNVQPDPPKTHMEKEEGYQKGKPGEMHTHELTSNNPMQRALIGLTTGRYSEEGYQREREEGKKQLVKMGIMKPNQDPRDINLPNEKRKK